MSDDPAPRPRTDAGARVLVDRIDEVRAQAKALRAELAEVGNSLASLEKAVGKVEVWAEVQNERHQHVVTWGKLGVTVFTMAFGICGACWALTQDAIRKMEALSISTQTQVSTRLNTDKDECAQLEHRLTEHLMAPTSPKGKR